MAKDGRRECRECDGPDLSSLFGNKGNGDCRNCHGKGIVYGLEDAVTSIGTFGTTPDFHPCEICKKTGQCQNCGGTGYKYYYENDYSNREEYRGGGSSSGNSEGESPASLILIAFLIFCIISFIRSCP